MFSASLVPIRHFLVENSCLLFASPFFVSAVMCQLVSILAVVFVGWPVSTAVALLLVGPLVAALAHVVVWVVVFLILAVILAPTGRILSE